MWQTQHIYVGISYMYLCMYTYNHHENSNSCQLLIGTSLCKSLLERSEQVAWGGDKFVLSSMEELWITMCNAQSTNCQKFSSNEDCRGGVGTRL